MNLRLGKIAPLLFLSGLSALIYQTAWSRELRLVFGASTAASAAVLAIFMGGLGLGGALLGARADAQRRPLAFYAKLELVAALSSAATPGLVWLVRRLYILLGGTVILGSVFGTVIRLLLSALVLAIPTLAMGGTLPAAARASESPDDVRRNGVAALYAVNTLGAVTGALLSTFVLIERHGTRVTLWLACLLNLGVALAAWVLARGLPEREPSTRQSAAAARPREETGEALPPAALVLGAATGVGFAFFLLELVWYRMLSPLLGGSTFTFGLILAVALFGIGLGGLLYALWGRNRPATLYGFALTCVAEATCVALPFALGDRVAVFAMLLRSLGAHSFLGLTLSWTAVTALVVGPAAFVSGYQFPMLIALLGRGEEGVGRQVGLAYAWNTVGSILGSLGGGFGLLPLLTAPGAWRLSAALLVSMGGAALAVALRREWRGTRALGTAALGGLAVAMLFARGPTAAWRHSGIGVGRARLEKGTLNGLHQWANSARRALYQEMEGRESGVGLNQVNGLAFVVNGKSDGNAKVDAGTQVMGPVVGALLHPHPRHALVIGLGTGSSAGWLAALPEVERVDVVEIEPAIVEVARICTPVNHDVLANSKIHVILGDAREVLLASREKYDLISSEPSNPYRAGIASLFTREFYQAIKARLADDGMFLQWIQAYEVDGRTLQNVYATLTSVFPQVSTWQTEPGDLDLVATLAPLRHDAAALRGRIRQGPYREALFNAWRVVELEGVLAHFLAGPEYAAAAATDERRVINTDDRNDVEFSFGRTVGRTGLFQSEPLRRAAARLGADRPRVEGQVDWPGVERARLAAGLADGLIPPADEVRPELRPRQAVFQRYLEQGAKEALALWRQAPWEGRDPVEWALLAELLASAGDEKALAAIEQLRAFQPIEADLFLAVLRQRQGNGPEAARLLESALVRHQADPWVSDTTVARALELAEELARQDPPAGGRLYRVLQRPFSIFSMDYARRTVLARLARLLDWKGLCVGLLQADEPDVIWTERALAARVSCYEQNSSPLLAQAKRDLEDFRAAERSPVLSGSAR